MILYIFESKFSVSRTELSRSDPEFLHLADTSTLRNIQKSGSDPFFPMPPSPLTQERGWSLPGYKSPEGRNPTRTSTGCRTAACKSPHRYLVVTGTRCVWGTSRRVPAQNEAFHLKVFVADSSRRAAPPIRHNSLTCTHPNRSFSFQEGAILSFFPHAAARAPCLCGCTTWRQEHICTWMRHQNGSIKAFRVSVIPPYELS